MSDSKVIIQVAPAKFTARTRAYENLGHCLERETTTGKFYARIKLHRGAEPKQFPVTRTRIAIPGTTENAARKNLVRLLDQFDQFSLGRGENPFTRQDPLAFLTIGQLADRWESFKKSDTTLAHKSLVEIRSYARWIRNTLGALKPAALERHRIELMLRQLPVSNNTRRKYLRFLRMFATWLKHESLLSSDPFKGIVFKPDDVHAEFYSVDEIKTLLRFVADRYTDLAGYYALLIFAGLRPSEGLRVRWEDINFQTSELYVRKGKTNARHIILEPVALQWILWHRSNTAHNRPFIEQTNFTNREKRLRAKALKRSWIQDGLRHGFGTFYRARIKDVGKVADYMGNSPNIVKRHYARTVPRSECERFWKMFPTETTSGEIQLELSL